MRFLQLRLTLLIMWVLFLPIIGLGQISIPDANPVTENFTIGTSTTASLPTNWKMSSAGTGSNSLSFMAGTNITAVTQGASSGSPTAGGSYNWGNGTTTTDRAIGFMTSGGYASPNAIMAFYRNTSGSIINDINISFDFERYRINTAVVSIQLYTSTNGTSWTAQTTGDIATSVFATGTSAYNFTGGTVASKSVSLLSVNLAHNSDFYIMWLVNTTGTNSQGVGLDNVSITASLAVSSGASTLAAGPVVEPASFSALLNTQGAAVQNFDFTIQDDGSNAAADALETQISQIRFRQGTGNDIPDWTIALLGAELSDGTNTLTGTINATNITFSSIPNSTGQLGYIADNASKTYTLKVWLKSDLTTLKTTIDGSNFVFRVLNADFTITGSQLDVSQDINSGSSNNAVAVASTALVFVQNTSNALVSNNMSPSPTVSANDANGNRDVDFTNSVSITSSGTLNTSPQTVASVLGLATFTIVHTATGTGLQLTASSSGLSTIVSGAFDITPVVNASAILWSGTGSSAAWLTVGNWTGGAVPGATQVAQFGAVTSTGNTVGINMNTTGGTLSVGGIEFTTARANPMSIGNSSGANGVLTIASVAINSIANVAIRNNSTQLLTIKDNVSGSSLMGVSLGNATDNKIGIEGTGGVIISSIMSGSNPLTKIGSGSGILQLTAANTYTGLTTVTAGTLQLSRVGGTTIPITNNITINGGTLKVSSNQTLNNLILTSGTLTVDAGVTLTINGTYTGGGTIVNNGTIVIVGPASFPGTSTTITTCNNLEINRSGGVVLDKNLAVSGSLILTSGAFSIGSNTLTLNGTVTGSGTISGSASSNLTIGGAAGTINFTNGARTLQNLIIGTGSASSLTLGTDLDITSTGGITFNAAGTKSLTTTGKILTLKSTVAGTAYIGNLNGATITGNITAERFISSRARRWRFLASPFSNATFEDLRQEIYITGSGVGNTVGTVNSNGFDATLSNIPSVYSYNEATGGDLNQGWVALTNSTASLSNQTIVAGKGYRIFVRGDRSDPGRLNGVVTAQNAVTINLTGTINSGDILMPVTYTTNGGLSNDGWNLVSNPYPCPFDWKAFRDDGANLTNMDSTIYILDATSGSYKSYNSFSNGGSLTGGVIPAGASFWVKANNTAPSMTFKEQFKKTSQPVDLYKTSVLDELNMKLVYDSVTSDNFMLAHHAGSTVYKDAYDIRKLNGEVNMMSVGKDGVSLTYDARPISASNDTVQLYVSGGNSNYTLEVQSIPFTSERLYYLIDKKLGGTYLLSNGFTLSYTTTTTDTSSFGYRFMLVISSSSTLPVLLQKFDALKEQKQVSLRWSTASEVNSDYFEVEHSVDAQNWKTIGTVKAAGNSSSIRYYRFTDETPNLNGENYYRLKEVDFNKDIFYSTIQVVTFGDDLFLPFSLQPNPALNLVSIQTKESIQQVEISDMKGRKILETKLSNFNVAEWDPGIYIVRVICMNGKVHSQKLIKN